MTSNETYVDVVGKQCRVCDRYHPSVSGRYPPPGSKDGVLCCWACAAEFRRVYKEHRAKLTTEPHSNPVPRENGCSGECTIEFVEGRVTCKHCRFGKSRDVGLHPRDEWFAASTSFNAKAVTTAATLTEFEKLSRHLQLAGNEVACELAGLLKLFLRGDEPKPTAVLEKLRRFNAAFEHSSPPTSAAARSQPPVSLRPSPANSSSGFNGTTVHSLSTSSAYTWSWPCTEHKTQCRQLFEAFITPLTTTSDYLAPTIFADQREMISTSLAEWKRNVAEEGLNTWRAEQCRLSVGSKRSQDDHLSAFEVLDSEFAELYRFLSHCEETVQPMISDSDVSELALLGNSVQAIRLQLSAIRSPLMAIQPPPVVEAGKAFSVDARILGNSALRLHIMSSECRLEVVECAESPIERAEPLHASLWPSGYHAHKLSDGLLFEGVVIDEDDERAAASESRFRLRLHYSLRGSCEVVYEVVESLPFAIVGKHCDTAETKARVILERSFCAYLDHDNFELPSTVGRSEMASVLERIFQAVLSSYRIEKGSSRGAPPDFNKQTIDHLLNRLQENSGAVNPLGYLNLRVAKRLISSEDVEEISFYQWYEKLANIVAKYMPDEWNDGLIYGFCSMRAAEDLLQQSMLMIRFSDQEPNAIRVSYRDVDGAFHEYTCEEAEMKALGRGKAVAMILNDPRFNKFTSVLTQRGAVALQGVRGAAPQLPTVAQRYSDGYFLGPTKMLDFMKRVAERNPVLCAVKRRGKHLFGAL